MIITEDNLYAVQEKLFYMNEELADEVEADDELVTLPDGCGYMIFHPDNRGCIWLKREDDIYFGTWDEGVLYTSEDRNFNRNGVEVRV